MMINPNYVDGLELRIKELTVERNELIQRNAESVVMVDALSSITDTFIENIEEVTELLTASGDAPNIVLLVNALNQIADDIETLPTPVQHLRQIQAEAGRAGFVAGRMYGLIPEHQKIMREVVGVSADLYANRIKVGQI